MNAATRARVLGVMDELGIDIQVLHNTFWIEQVTTRAQAEVAICRSWNRWLADISKKSQGRLFYSCVVPAMDIGEAIAEIKFARENGAAAPRWLARADSECSVGRSRACIPANCRVQ